MASNTRRLDQKTLLILSAVLGVESLACVGLGMSIHNRKAALEKTLAGKEAALADVRTVSASLPALQAQYAKMQAQVQFLESALPPAEYIPTLLGQVEQTAKACGVAIQEFRPKAAPSGAAGSGPNNPEAEENTGSTKMQFDVVIRGNYRQVQRFLQSLTRFRKILALDTLTLTPTKTGEVGTSPLLTGNMSFTAYVLTPEPGSAPSGAPGAARGDVRNVASAAVGAAETAAAGAARQAAADRGLTSRDGADRT